MNDDLKRAMEAVAGYVIQREFQNWVAAGKPADHICADAFRLVQWLADDFQAPEEQQAPHTRNTGERRQPAE